MAVFTVINTDNDGVGSLRWAVERVNVDESPDSIVFDASLAGETITLLSEISITSNMSVDDDITVNNQPME